jgi:hypothetical protein
MNYEMWNSHEYIRVIQGVLLRNIGTYNPAVGNNYGKE